MVRLLLMLIAFVTVFAPRSAYSQQASRLVPVGSFVRQPTSDPARRLSSLPDSVRKKVGYQHWKGGAIGASLGALAGLALALAAHGQCDDCVEDSPPVARVTAIAAGLAGAFGFLVGAATPRYRWVPVAQP